MRSIKRTAGVILVAILTAGAASAAPSVASDDTQAPMPVEAQPHMQAALKFLRSAEVKLENATTDKGGHRAKAVILVRAAIVQAEKGVEFDNANSTAAGDTDADARDAQPRMKEALVALKLAKSQLNKATEDKGGHRAKALKLTDEAIEQVTKGIVFDNRK
jgi:hypothetical protein